MHRTAGALCLGFSEQIGDQRHLGGRHDCPRLMQRLMQGADAQAHTKPIVQELLDALPREAKAMLRQLGYGFPVRTVSGSVAACFLLALLTGMRAGELCAIKWADVTPDYVRLHTSKTGAGRDVPLTHGAHKLIERMRGWDDESVFGLKTQTLDALFRKARGRCGLDGFHYHDTRHTAATRLAQHLHVLDLCRVFGWRTTAQAMTYYQPKASDIARRLRSPSSGAPTR